MKIILLAVASAFLFAFTISAQTVIVTPSNTQGWTGVPPGADTRPGGTVGITNFSDGSGGNGSLHLTTDATNAAKAQYMHAANVPLSDVTELGYSTYQQSANFPGGDASYQLPVCLGGVDSSGHCVGFTTFVYEPYENGAVVNGQWQQWDVDAGLFWSSRTVALGTCNTTAGAGGAPFYTLSAINAMCPDAVAVGFGVNVGTFNPSYSVYVDFVNFNGTTYNFEVYQVPTSADQCKNGGWMTLKRTGGTAGFKNQGDCIQYVNTGK